MNNRFFLTLLFIMPVNYSTAQLDESKVGFIEDVIFITEYENRPQRFCKRWTSGPKLSAFGDGELHPKVIKNVTTQLNRCLPAEIQIQILEPRDELATLKVFFIPYAQMGQLAEENGFQFVEGNWGVFFCKWNDQFEIQNAVVLIATDRVSGYRLHHFVLEEITQSLGLPGDSQHLSKSVFYENVRENKFGKATLLCEEDRQLIQFHYRHNRPGDSPIKVGMNFVGYLDSLERSK